MQGTVMELVLHAGLFVKAILLMLAGLSVFSWAVIGYKAYYVAAAARESEVFLKAMASTDRPSELLSVANTLSVSPLANAFQAVAAHPGSASRETLRRVLSQAEHQEIEKLQAYLTFLATTGSTAPFIGLLGTVWGIMNAFRGIGVTGSASLAVVAPGIAEALITTAAGLAAAIPAVVAYNSYISRARTMAAQMEHVSEELLDRVARKAA